MISKTLVGTYTSSCLLVGTQITSVERQINKHRACLHCSSTLVSDHPWQMLVGLLNILTSCLHYSWELLLVQLLKLHLTHSRVLHCQTAAFYRSFSIMWHCLKMSTCNCACCVRKPPMTISANFMSKLNCKCFIRNITLNMLLVQHFLGKLYSLQSLLQSSELHIHYNTFKSMLFASILHNFYVCPCIGRAWPNLW